MGTLAWAGSTLGGKLCRATTPTVATSWRPPASRRSSGSGTCPGRLTTTPLPSWFEELFRVRGVPPAHPPLSARQALELAEAVKTVSLIAMTPLEKGSIAPRCKLDFDQGSSLWGVLFWEAILPLCSCHTEAC